MSGSFDGGALVQAYSNFAANQNKDPYATAKSAADLANVQQQTAASQASQAQTEQQTKNLALEQFSKQMGIQGQQSMTAATDPNQWNQSSARTWIAKGLSDGSITPQMASGFSDEIAATGGDPGKMQQFWLNHAQMSQSVKDQIDFNLGKIKAFTDSSGVTHFLRESSDKENITNPQQAGMEIAGGVGFGPGMTPAEAGSRVDIPTANGTINVPLGSQGPSTSTPFRQVPSVGGVPVVPSVPNANPQPGTSGGNNNPPPQTTTTPGQRPNAGARLHPTTQAPATTTANPATTTDNPPPAAPNQPAGPTFVPAGNDQRAKNNVSNYNTDMNDDGTGVGAVTKHAQGATNLMLAHDALEVAGTGKGTGAMQDALNVANTILRTTNYKPIKPLESMSRAELDKYLTGYAATAAGTSTDYGKQLSSLANANGEIDPQAARDIVNKNIGMERMQVAASKLALQNANGDPGKYDKGTFLADNANNYQAFAWDAYTPAERGVILQRLKSDNQAEESFMNALKVAKDLKLINVGRQNHFKGGVTLNPAPSTIPGGKPLPGAAPSPNGLAPPPPNPNGLSGQ